MTQRRKQFSLLLTVMALFASPAKASYNGAACEASEDGMNTTVNSVIETTSPEQTLTFRLWPNGKPNESGLTEDGDTSNPGWYTLIAEPELYVYRPENPNGTAILMCPGGGYYGLAMSHEGKDMKDWFNSMGITYAVLKYRMPNGNHEVPLSDAEEAMRILRGHADEWGLRSDKIGVMGASAGGHLASTLATHYSSAETRPDFQILFYPVITMEEGVTHPGSREFLIGKDPSSELVTLYSNEEQVEADTPQAFIMVSADDDVVPLENSLRYARALSDNKVPFSLHVYPTGGHGWGFLSNFLYHQQWREELNKWLRENILYSR